MNKLEDSRYFNLRSVTIGALIVINKCLLYYSNEKVGFKTHSCNHPILCECPECQFCYEGGC